MRKEKPTKADLIRAIELKVQRADPLIRDDFVKGLKYKNKSTLKRYLRKVKVDRDRKGISLI